MEGQCCKGWSDICTFDWVSRLGNKSYSVLSSVFWILPPSWFCSQVILSFSWKIESLYAHNSIRPFPTRILGHQTASFPFLLSQTFSDQWYTVSTERKFSRMLSITHRFHRDPHHMREVKSTYAFKTIHFLYVGFLLRHLKFNQLEPWRGYSVS